MKEKYSIFPSPTGMSETIYKYTEQETISVLIVYQSDCKSIWSVEIKKLINTQGGKFYVKDEESWDKNKISKKDFDEKLETAINFLKQTK